MSLPTTHCPDCNSRQRLAPRRRQIAGSIEVYIRCFACGYENVVETMTRQEWIERRKKTVRQIRGLRRAVG